MKNKIPQKTFNQGSEIAIHANSKPLMKETEEDTNKWKDILCSQVRRTNIANSIPPKVINTFNAIPINSLMVLFKKLKKNPEICMKLQATSKSQSNIEREKQIWKHHNS